jgi:anti-sigma B factor antagonist
MSAEHGIDQPLGMMTANEQITTGQIGDDVVVTLTGQFTGGEESEAFHEVLQTAMRDGVRTVIVDLAGVTYINSSFIGGLLAAHTSITRRGGAIVLRSVPPAIEEILRVTRLDMVFETIKHKPVSTKGEL